MTTDALGIGTGRAGGDLPATLESADRALLAATQAGLPLVPRPFAEIAQRHGLDETEVISRFRGMMESGVIRRVAAVPNHYALGYRANGMSVWDVADEAIHEAGVEVGALPFVSHCYQRPRRPPEWPYSLFAMVHGRDRSEVASKVAEIASLLGPRDRGHEVLFSTRVLKKTGVRMSA